MNEYTLTVSKDQTQKTFLNVYLYYHLMENCCTDILFNLKSKGPFESPEYKRSNKRGVQFVICTTSCLAFPIPS